MHLSLLVFYVNKALFSSAPRTYAITFLWHLYLTCLWVFHTHSKSVPSSCWIWSMGFWGDTSSLYVTNILKMKQNRSLNTTNGLLANMESSYVTTCFGLLLWPSSGYSLVALRVYTICLKVASWWDLNHLKTTI